MESPVPPPMETIFNGALSLLRCCCDTKGRLGMETKVAHGVFNCCSGSQALTAFLRRLLFFVFFLDRNGIQVLGFEDLTAVPASDVINTLAPVQKFGLLVLTTLHSRNNNYSRLSNITVKWPNRIFSQARNPRLYNLK